MDFINREPSSDMIVYITNKYNKEKINGKKVINGIFEVMDILGQGSFWKVFKVRRNLKTEEAEDYNYYVFKEGNLSKRSGDNITAVAINELKIQSEINHVNIARLYECIIDEDIDKIVFIMEYCDGGSLMNINDNQTGYTYNKELLNLIANDLGLNLSNEIDFAIDYEAMIIITKYIFSQLADAIKYIHRKVIAHCDIKPENILFKSLQLKLIDFSISIKVEGMVESSQGSYYFKPPEILLYKSHNPFKVDIYQFGANMYLFLFNNINFDLKIKEVEILKKYSPELYNILKNCLNEDPDDRPDIDFIISYLI